MPHCVESHDINNFENYCYGDGEVERFFGNDLSLDQEPTEPSSPQQFNSLLHTEEVAISQSKVLEELRTFYSDTCTMLNSKTITVQRDIGIFWYVQQREKIDLREHNINVIFAGEAAADAGGPHYEFLTLCIGNFSSHPVVYRTQNVFFLRNSPLDCLSRTCFTLRHLTALSIMKLGRGPECLNYIIVLKLFEQDLPERLPASCFQEFENSINQIGNCEYDILLHLNIISVKDNAVNKRRFIVTHTLIEPAGGIQEFKNSLLSIAPTILNPSNYSVMKDLFVAPTVQIDIQSILKLFVFKQEVQEGSNEKRVIVHYAIFKYI